MKNKINNIKCWLLSYLLHWYITEQMDQWESWKVTTNNGPVYIDISYHPYGKPEFYEDIT
jgi:hypothetical protein